MSKETEQLIVNQLSNNHVIFNVSAHMLNNSEMNATVPIREFLSSEAIFDFDKLEDGNKEYLECIILHQNQSTIAKVRVGFPPNKREHRFWVYGLNNYTEPNDSILMSILDNRLVVIPLNQEIKDLVNLQGLIRSSKLNFKTKRALKKQKRNKKYKAFKKDHLNQALLNMKLGLEGEIFICFLERQNLLNLEREDLAEKVEHKSVTEGDGLGYDILSFDANGNKKYIEVKTTKGKCNTRFFISPNEVSYSSENTENYYLYRVYEFDKSKEFGKVKIVKGDISKHIDLEPNSYSGILKE